MEFKIIKLNKEDLVMYKELDVLSKNIESNIIKLQSKRTAMWNLWKRKYKLAPGVSYIKNKAIYTQVV